MQAYFLPITSTQSHHRTQYLSLRHVMTVVGEEEWSAIGESDFPVTVLVAGKGSACRLENVELMEQMVPRAEVLYLPGSFHAIHHWSPKDFDFAIKSMYKEINQRKKSMFVDDSWKTRQ